MELDEKSERIAILEREVKAKELESKEAEKQFQDLQHKYQ